MMSGSSFDWSSRQSLIQTLSSPALLDALFSNLRHGKLDGGGGESDESVHSSVVKGQKAVAFLRPSGLPDATLSRVWRNGTNGTGEISDRDGLRRVLTLVKEALEEEERRRMTSSGAAADGGLTMMTSGLTPTSVSSNSIQSKPMSEKDKVKYEKHFSSLDVNRSGMVTAENAVQFLGKASLPEREIREIVRKRSRGAMSLTCDAFSLAMHDVYAVIKAKGSGGHGVTPMVSGNGGAGANSTPGSVMNAQFASLNTPQNQYDVSLDTFVTASRNNNNNNNNSINNTTLARLDTPDTYSRPPLDLGFSMENAAVATPADPREQAKLEKELNQYESKVSQSDQRNQRARDAIESTRAKVDKMREAAERAEKNAQEAKREAQSVIEDAEKKRSEYRTRAMTAKARVEEQMREKEKQMQVANRDLEKLRQKVEQAESVSALPLKSMESKLRALQFEVTRVKTAAKNRQDALSAELVRKGAEIREMERLKAAAIQDAENIERQFKEKREQSEQALERGKQALEAAKKSTLNAENQHFERVERVRELLVDAKKEYVKEKEALVAAKKKFESELAKLEEERAQAAQEFESQRIVTKKARDAHRLQLQNKRIMLEEASDALKEAKKQRDVIEAEHKASLATANENFQRTETRLNAEKAKLKQTEEKHKGVLKDIEEKIESAESRTEDIIRQIENADRDLEKRKNELETRLEVATESLEKTEEELRGTKLRVDAQREELDLREQACQEKEAEAENAAESSKSLIKSMEEDVNELRTKIEAEEKRVNEETSAVQRDLEAKRAHLELETTKLEAALDRARDVFPRESAAAQQAYALEAMIATTESAREEAERSAAESEAQSEKNMARLMELAEMVGNANTELKSSSKFTGGETFSFTAAAEETTSTSSFEFASGASPFAESKELKSDAPEPFTGGFAEAEDVFSPQVNLKKSSSANAFAFDDGGTVMNDADFGDEFDAFAKPKATGSSEQPLFSARSAPAAVEDIDGDDPFDVDFGTDKNTATAAEDNLRKEAKEDDAFFKDFGDDAFPPSQQMERESSKENVEWFEDGMNNSIDHEQQQHDLDDDDDDDDGIFGRPIAANDGGRMPPEDDLAFEEEDFFAPIAQKPVQSFEDFNDTIGDRGEQQTNNGFEDTNDTDDAFKQPGQLGRNKFDDDDDAFNDEFSGDFNSRDDNNGANNNNMNDDGFSDDFGDFESSRQSVEAAGSFTNKALKTSNVDTTFDDDATDEDDEPSSPNRQQQSSNVASAVPEITEDVGDKENELPLYISRDDLERSKNAWYTLRKSLNDPNALGVTGAQVAAMATKTGLPNEKLAGMWNASCTSDGSSLGLGDFCVFMHLLKHALNGGSMPDFRIEGSFREEMLGADIVNEEARVTNEAKGSFLKDEESETEKSAKEQQQQKQQQQQQQQSMPPPVNIATPPHAQSQQQQQQQQQQQASPTRRSAGGQHSPTRRGSDALPIEGQSQRLKVFIDSVANVKDASKMQQVHCKVSLVDTNGQELEQPQNTAVGARPGNDANSLTLQNAVTLSSAPATWPAGSAVLIELRHFKKKENKVSTRCWSFMEKESVRPGLFGLPLAKKPADPLRQRVALFNKGTPDLKLRFSFV